MRAMVRAVFLPRRLEIVVCIAASIALGAFGSLLAASIPPPGPFSPPGALIDVITYCRDGYILVPILIATLLGSTIVAAELENRTAAFAWFIARSRSRWLMEMVGGGLVLVVLASLPLSLSEHYVSGVLSSLPSAQMPPLGLDPSPVLTLFRALLVFTFVCLIGAVTGRVLRTMLIGIVAGFVVLAVLETTFFAWRDTQVSIVDPSTPGALLLGSQVATLNGRLLSSSEAQSAINLGPEFDQQYQVVTVGLSPSKRAEIVTEECAAAALLATGALAVMFLVIERRRTD